MTTNRGTRVSGVPITEWPGVRDASRQLDVCAPYVNRLIHRQRLRAVRTRIGWLVDPDSLAAYEAARRARLEKRSA
jgi:hypothetical protein